MPATGPVSSAPYASLRIPDFRRYIVGLLTFTVAVQIQGTVVGWQMYELTHDKLALGLIGLAEALPFIGTALYAGHIADRHDRRRVALAALTVLAGCSAALLVLPMLLPGAPKAVVRAIYGVIIVSGFARSFLQPARQALGAEIVPRELYGNAVTWRSGTWQLASVVGPAVGGLLYAIGGTTLSYAADVVLMLAGIGAIAMVRHRSDIRPEHTEAVGRSLATGIRFVWGEPILLGALSLDLFSVLFGGATALLPVFADEILHVGPQGLGLLRAAPAVGAVATSVVLAYASAFKRTGHVLLRAVAAFGLCMIAFGLSTSFVLSVAVLALGGAADMVSVFIRSTLIQTMTPTHMLGRVSSVNAIFVGSSNEIGAFESGVTAKLLGTVPSVVLGGLATLVVVAVTAARLPTLRKLGRMDGQA
ncbi:MAG TPA: MFS transporter [Gemmatimonadaceae bacterium]|nr:MFS transporter [Gemmatimonadaceae bacterium]